LHLKNKSEFALSFQITCYCLSLSEAHLEEADLSSTELERANLSEAYLKGADLSKAKLADPEGIGPVLVDIHWEGTSLTVFDWSQVQILRDEHHTYQKITNGTKKDHGIRSKEYRDAYRANHQLSVALQEQGLIEDATRFAYRAKNVRRKALWHEFLDTSQKKRVSVFGALLFSWVLFLLAGYGYRLRWCLLWPVGLVIAFATLYWWLKPAQMT
jgi:hypothetical protein